MSKKILIIDDNDQDRKIIKRFLNKAGFKEIIMAETGEKGLEEAKLEAPDLIIVDTLLPGMDGFEVCRKLREMPFSAPPKIIVMTGFVDAVDAVKAREMGADDYTVKTDDCSSLIIAVQDLFDSPVAVKGTT